MIVAGRRRTNDLDGDLAGATDPMDERKRRVTEWWMRGVDGWV